MAEQAFKASRYGRSWTNWTVKSATKWMLFEILTSHNPDDNHEIGLQLLRRGDLVRACSSVTLGEVTLASTVVQPCVVTPCSPVMRTGCCMIRPPVTEISIPFETSCGFHVPCWCEGSQLPKFAISWREDVSMTSSLETTPMSHCPYSNTICSAREDDRHGNEPHLSEPVQLWSPVRDKWVIRMRTSSTMK